MGMTTLTKKCGDLSHEEKKILKHVLGLSSKKQKRFTELVQLYQDSTDDQERLEIANVVAEVMFQQPTDLQSISLDVDDTDAKRKLARHRNFVANNIAKHRRKRKWSQEELAERAGLPQSHVSRLERCVHAPSYMTIEKLADAFGVKPGELDPSFD